MKHATRRHGIGLLLLCVAVLQIPHRPAKAQTFGTQVPYQQSLIAADRLQSSPSQQAYRTASSTSTYLSADAALVQFNATTATTFTASLSVTLTNASAVVAFSGGAATITSSAKTFKLFDPTNTGGMTIALDGSNNPTLTSSGGLITIPSKINAAQSIQISNSTGRVEYAGNGAITSATNTFRFYDDTMTGGIIFTVDGSYNGGISTSGGNFTANSVEFIVTTASAPRISLQVTNGASTGNVNHQCYPDTPGICSIGFNFRWIGSANTPSFQRPNAAKNAYLIESNQNGAADEFGIYYVNGPNNADIHPAFRIVTTTPSVPLFVTSLPMAGAFNWRQLYTSGSGTVTIPSWVTRLYITAVGAGGSGTAGLGGGGGGCILEMPIVVTTAYATTISYTIGSGALAGSGSAGTQSTVTYNLLQYIGLGGSGGSSGNSGAGGGVTVNSISVPGATGGSAGAGAGGAGGQSPPYFFGGGGGGTGTAAAGGAGFIAGNSGGSANGAGGSSCMGFGAGSVAATGYGAGGNGAFAGKDGYVEFYGVGGI